MSLMTKLKTKHYSEGFTLTELVVALAVFGIVTVAIINMINLMQQTQRSERYLDMANTAAKQIVEQARNGGYDTLVAGQTYNRTDLVSDLLPGRAASMTVSNSSEMPDFKRLDVDVSYQVGTLTRHVYSSAIIGKGGITP